MSEDPLADHVRPSTAARAFLAKAAPVAETIGDIESYRAACRAEFLPRGDRAVATHGVTTSWAEIAGIRCQIVEPAERDGEFTLLHGFGGGFVSGSPEEERIVTAPLAAGTRARVVVPAYRLAPEHPWPAAIDDGAAVYARLAATVPPGQLALSGESAGGNLALSIMQRAFRDGLRLPAALALMSPWCDLADGGDSLGTNDGRDPTLSAGFIAEAIRHYAGTVDPCDPGLSPLLGPWPAATPPVLVTSASRDLLLSQSIQLSRVLREAGAEVELCLWDDLWHVFEFYDELPEAAESLARIAGFLRSRMNPPPAGA